jgi:DNA-binding transcriptional regulator YiaG
MAFSNNFASVSERYSSIGLQDPFLGMGFTSQGKTLFFKLLESLKRWSDIADEQNPTNNVDQLNVTGQHDSQQKAFRSIQRNSVLDIPPQLPWAQIRELHQNIVNAIQQAVHTWADINPEQARDVMFYIQSIGQKNQIPDAEAVELIQAIEQNLANQEGVNCAVAGPPYSSDAGAIELIQAVEQNSANQEKVNLIIDGHHHLVVFRHKPRENASEETNSQKKLTSSSYPPDYNNPKDLKCNDDDTQDTALEKDTNFAQAERTISGVGENAQDGRLVARELPESELSDQLGSAEDQNNLPSPIEKFSPITSQRVTKVYSEVENPAELVRELRERYNLSQESFARKMKVAFATVNRWENGHSTPRSIAIKSLKRLTKDLGEQGEDLLEKHFPNAYQKRKKRKVFQASNL